MMVTGKKQLFAVIAVVVAVGIVVVDAIYEGVDIAVGAVDVAVVVASVVVFVVVSCLLATNHIGESRKLKMIIEKNIKYIYQQTIININLLSTYKL